MLCNNVDSNNNDSDNNDNVIDRHNSRILQSPYCATNCLQHVLLSGQGAILCKSCATRQGLITFNMSCTLWYQGTAQLLSLSEF